MNKITNGLNKPIHGRQIIEKKILNVLKNVNMYE